jgi:hydroxyethylthiazole kinase-like uncharacterized protein yjeF
MKSLCSEYPTAVYTANQIRQLDRMTVDELGVTSYELMRRAGKAAFGLLRNHWPQAQTMAVFCGPGNNGGDAYVLAEFALESGMQVRLISVTPEQQLQGNALEAWSRCRQQGVRFDVFSEDCPLAEDVIVDGLLGIGLSRGLEGNILAAVDMINASGIPVLALDIPTGLDSNTGMVHGSSVKADVTVAFVGLNQGLFLGVGPDCVGKLEFSSLSIPSSLYDQVTARVQRITTSILEKALRPRSQLVHKGMNGSLLLVGGEPGMSGAIRLASEAALRSGAGLVRVATHPDSVASVMAGRAEVMCYGVMSKEELQPLLQSAEAVVLGPGLGQSAWAQNLWQCVIESQLPVILDADGLNLLSSNVLARGNWILTPHPGEAARLLKTDTATVQADRLGAVIELAKQFKGVTVLKGTCSLVSTGKYPISLCDGGNPGMATAGMGDVLAGLLGGLAVQTGNLELTAQAGVVIHAASGDSAALDGERGLLAGDVIGNIRSWMNPPYNSHK